MGGGPDSSRRSSDVLETLVDRITQLEKEMLKHRKRAGDSFSMEFNALRKISKTKLQKVVSQEPEPVIVDDQVASCSTRTTTPTPSEFSTTTPTEHCFLSEQSYGQQQPPPRKK